jgi:hypothetical protein
MGKWDKLTQQLDEALASMTQDDWVAWSNNIEKNDILEKRMLISRSRIENIRHSCNSYLFADTIGVLRNDQHLQKIPPLICEQLLEETMAPDYRESFFFINIAA